MASLAQYWSGPDFITGHQVCADFAILAASTEADAPVVDKARRLWHGRRGDGPVQVLDTRYDIGHLLEGASRRLVDVAGELALDVTQPELRGTSMTALHRAFIDRGDNSARERVSVLNLRHSLSTALIALRAAGYGGWDGTLNVNQMISGQAAGAWGWLDGPILQRLLGKEVSADT